MNQEEQQYLDLMKKIMDEGVDKNDRTGVGIRSMFGAQMRFDLSKSFPLLTTKKVFLRGITHELLWFLQGDTNIKYLVDNNVRIWNEWPFTSYLKANGLDDKYERYSDEWHEQLAQFVESIKSDQEFADKWGELGPVYGKQWVRWQTPSGETVNQIDNAIDLIRNNPNSRRIIVSAWNVSDLEEMTKAGLPPCHTLFQFYVADGKLSCQLYQRSADIFLGVPFNIASYALLARMMAQVCGLEPGEFVHTFGDVHIYNNHFDQVKEQLSRTPSSFPQMELNKDIKSIYDFKIGDFKLVGYDPQAAIKAPVAV